MRIFPGYCQLCRSQELQNFAELVGNVTKSGEIDERHVLACEIAGCKHPAYYRFDNDTKELEILSAEEVEET